MIGSTRLHDLGQDSLHGIRKDGSSEDVVNQPSVSGGDCCCLWLSVNLVLLLMRVTLKKLLSCFHHYHL